MEDNKRIKSFNEHQEKLDISDVIKSKDDLLVFLREHLSIRVESDSTGEYDEIKLLLDDEVISIDTLNNWK